MCIIHPSFCLLQCYGQYSFVINTSLLTVQCNTTQNIKYWNLLLTKILKGVSITLLILKDFRWKMDVTGLTLYSVRLICQLQIANWNHMLFCFSKFYPQYFFSFTLNVHIKHQGIVWLSKVNYWSSLKDNLASALIISEHDHEI